MRILNVLVCEEDRLLASSIAETLRGKGCVARLACSYREARSALREKLPHLILLSTDLDITNHIRQLAPGVPVITLTSGQATGSAKSRAAGAVATISKRPLDMAVLLEAVSGQRSAISGKKEEGRRQKAERMIGQSAVWLAALERARRLAALERPLLITGESGTGKELVARFVHEHSLQARGEFVPLNCAAMPEQLLESELFGHTRGAFTGACDEKPGLLEYADGGTVFLDEIGALPLSLQPKLLRFLQDHTVRKVGGTARVKVKVRIVAATNEVLREKVKAREFRPDLMYRLDVLRVDLPPLRERGDDVEELANYFLQRSAAEMGKAAPVLGEGVAAALRAHDWPGNVRELESVIYAAVALAEGGVVGKEILKR